MNNDYIKSTIIDAEDQLVRGMNGAGKEAIDVNTVMDLIAIAKELFSLNHSIAAGTRELRAYVEGNGFTWIEDESTVFNVTTAIGLMGGTIEAYKAAETK